MALDWLAYQVCRAGEKLRQSWYVLALLALGWGGCLYDRDDRCGPNQRLDDGLCRCVRGANIVNNECVLPLDAGAMQAPEAGPGAACDPESIACPEGQNSTCQRAPNGEHYCTASGCTDSRDCPDTFSCVPGPRGTYCRRPYTGQDAPCQAANDCAGFDANTCATLLMKCAVSACPLEGGPVTEGLPNTCDEGFVCFETSTVSAGAPNICIAASVLPP